jgi:hypothetical protein
VLVFAILADEFLIIIGAIDHTSKYTSNIYFSAQGFFRRSGTGQSRTTVEADAATHTFAGLRDIRAVGVKQRENRCIGD